MGNKVKNMGVSRSGLRFRIEPCQLFLLVSIILLLFSTSSATRAAAASSISTSTSSSCFNNNNNNNDNNGSMIQQQHQGNYCMEENDHSLELLSVMPVDRMLLNPADPFTGNTLQPNAESVKCERRKPYKKCYPNPNSPKIPEHCGGVYNPNRGCR